MFHLLNHPDALRTLTTEVRSTFANHSKIRVGHALNSCEYLSACIDETLRLTPIVGGCLMREVGAGGITIDGQFIPAGVDVGVPHHVIMRNPKYYTSPLEYLPERLLSSHTPIEEIGLARSAFCAFSLGPTGCVGKSWGLIQMKLTLAKLIFSYDLKIVRTDDEDAMSVTQRLFHRETHGLDVFVIANEGPHVMFRPEQRS